MGSEKKSFMEIGREKRLQAETEKMEKKVGNKERWATGREKVGVAWGKIKNFGSGIVSRVKGANEMAADLSYAVPDMVEAGVKGVKDKTVEAGKKVGKGVEIGVGATIEAGQKVGRGIKTGAEATREGALFVKDTALEFAGAAKDEIVGGIVIGGDKLNEFIDDKYESLKGMVKEGYGKVMDGKDMAVNKFSTGLENATNLYEGFKNNREQNKLSKRLAWVEAQLEDNERTKSLLQKERSELEAIMNLSASLEGAIAQEAV